LLLINTLKPYTMWGDDIIVVSTVLLFVLFTFVLYRSRLILAYKAKTFFSSRQTFAAGEIMTSKAELLDMVLLILIGCMSCGVIISSNIKTATATESYYSLLIQVFAIVALLVASKGILYSAVNWTFFPSDRGRGWLSAFFFSVAAVSAVAFPLSLFCIYANDIATTTRSCLLGVVVLQKILLLCKLFANFRPKRYGCLLFFLYFCSVEIMPTLVVWHLLTEID